MAVSRPNWVHPSKQSNAKKTSPVAPAGVTIGFRGATTPKATVEETPPNEVKLESTVQSAIDRIARDPRLSRSQKINEINIVLNMADAGNRPTNEGGISKGLKGLWNKYVVTPVVEDLKFAHRNVIQPWQNLAASAFNELTNIAGQAAIKTGSFEAAAGFADDPVIGGAVNAIVGREAKKVAPEEIEQAKRAILDTEEWQPSFNRFLKNQAKKQAYLPLYEDPKFESLPDATKMVGTVVGQIVTDPTTYMGVGPTAAIGRGARTALAVRMVEKYGDAVDANRIMRLGIMGVPKNIRQLEGLETGLRFAGQVIPRTEFVQDIWTATGTAARAKIGDAIFSPNAGAIRDAALMITPKSQRALVALGAGRANALTNADLLPELVKFTATKYFKGAAQTALHNWQRDLVKIGNERQAMMRPNIGTGINPMYDPEAVNMYRYIEMPEQELALQPISEPLKDLVRRAKAWQDNIRNQVNESLRKLGADFNVNVNEIGFIDDFFHHKMTQEAREWMASAKGREAMGRGLWRPTDLTAKDLTDPSGPFMFRRLRGGGNEEFFGVTVRDGTVDELNKIFGDWLEANNMPRMNWFETDAIAAMDSYAFSMSRAIGRNAFIRRAFDFGSDVIRPLIRTVVPDAELHGALTKVHDKLLRQQNILRTRIVQNTIRASDYAKSGADYAARFLRGEFRRKANITDEIGRVKRELDKLIGDLTVAAQQAAEKGASARGEFDVVNRALIEQIGVLQAALNDPERYAAGVELRNIYATMYPNHNPAAIADKTPEWFAEKIANGRGVPAARELRLINRELRELRGIVDAIPDGPQYAEARELLENVIAERSAVEQGFTNLSNVRAKATYSDTGLVYGYVNDLAPWAPQEGAKILRTKPFDEFFDSSPEAVAVKAFDQSQITDLRDPEVFEFFFQDWEQFPQALADSLRFHGMDEIAEVFEQQYKQFYDEGFFDPLAEDTYPEVISLIEDIFRKSTPDPDGVGDQQIYDIMTTIRERLMRTLDLEDPEGLDELMASVVDRSFHEYTTLPRNLNTTSGEQSVGLLMPQAFVDDMMLDELPDQWAVILPHDTAFPRTPSASPMGEVLTVAQNDLVQSVRQGVYEAASLEATTARSAAENALTDLDLGQIQRGDAVERIKELGRRKGGLTTSVNAKQRRIAELRETLARTDSVELTIAGEKRVVTRAQAQDQLVRLEADLAKKMDRLNRQIDAVYAAAGVPRVGSKGSGVVNKVNSYKERLPMLMNQAKVLKRWSEDVGIVLSKDIQDLRTLISQRPPKGAAAGESAAWARKVDRSLASIQSINDPILQRGYERVVTVLHADEAQLALLESVTILQIERQLDLMNKGLVGNIVETTLEGWDELGGMGLQMPQELVDLWKPNLEQLLTKAGRSRFMRAYDYTTRFFKTYATSTVGFFVRNGLSATFMNFVADVSSANIVDGFRAATAIARGPEAWAKFLDDLPVAERRIFEQAWEAAEATGRGQSDELAALTVRGGLGEAAVNNAYTRAFRKKNEFVERAVRMPMALDSLRRAQTFDQAVARVTRYHFDYSDLSQLDEAARKLVPFWIWTSRNVPLQITSQLVHPRVYNIYSRIKEASPVDDDIVMPKFLADWQPIGVGGVNEEGGQWVVTPDLPMERLRQQYEQVTDPTKIIGSFAPLLKVPFELIADRQLGIDMGPFKDKPQPVSGFDKLVLVPIAKALAGDSWIGISSETGEVLLDERIPYVAQNAMPLLGQLYRTSGGAFGGRQSSSYSERQLGSILSWLGLPVRYIGPAQQESERFGRIMDIADYIQEQVDKGKWTKKADLPDIAPPPQD
jgi:hypothetical protein